MSATALLLAVVLVPFFLFGAAVEARTAEAMAAPGAIGLVAGVLLALDALLPVPSSLVATATGAALGAWAGTAINTVGLTAGCLIGLVVGRSTSPVARQVLGPALYGRFLAWVERYGVVAVLLCRAVPVLAEASLIALGAARARMVPILAAAAVADLGLGSLYAFAGAAAGPAAAPAAPAFAAAIGVPVAASLVALLWIRRWRDARPAPPKPTA